MKRDLAMAVDPALFPDIEGSTDSELFFFLALTFGLEDDPPAAVARAVGFIEATGAARRRVPDPDDRGHHRRRDHWAFRYSSEGRSRSLFHSTDVSPLRHQYPDNPILQRVSDDARLVVSEPLGDLQGAWREVPESTCVTISGEVPTGCRRSTRCSHGDRPSCSTPSMPRARPTRPGWVGDVEVESRPSARC